MQSKKIESCLASALLLAIHGFGEVRQSLVNPWPRRRQRGMNQFVNQVDARELRIFRGHRCHQQRAAFKWSGIRIGKIGDGNRRAWLTEPATYKFHGRIERIEISRGPDLVARQAEQVQGRLRLLYVTCRHKCRCDRAEYSPMASCQQRPILRKISIRSSIGAAQQRLSFLAAGTGQAEASLEFAPRFPRLPSIHDLKQTVPLREIRRLSCNRIPRHISRAAHRCKR